MCFKSRELIISWFKKKKKKRLHLPPKDYLNNSDNQGKYFSQGNAICFHISEIFLPFYFYRLCQKFSIRWKSKAQMSVGKAVHGLSLLSCSLPFIFGPRSSLLLEWGTKRKREKRQSSVQGSQQWLQHHAGCSQSGPLVSFSRQALAWSSVFSAGRAGYELSMCAYFNGSGGIGWPSLSVGWVCL